MLRAGAGPQPIPVDKLRTRRLVEAIRAMNKPEVRACMSQASLEGCDIRNGDHISFCAHLSCMNR